MKWKVLLALLAFDSLFANSDISNLLQRHSFKLGRYLLAIFMASNVVNAKIVKDLKSYEDACLDSIAWEKVTILVPESFYQKYKNKILKEIPNEDECKLKDYDPTTGKVNFPIVEKNQKKYYQIAFKAVDWWEMDASDLVEKERKEAEQAKRQAEQEGYYGWFLDIFNKEILPRTKKNNYEMVIKGLSKINKNIKLNQEIELCKNNMP